MDSDYVSAPSCDYRLFAMSIYVMTTPLAPYLLFHTYAGVYVSWWGP